ncbi:MAG: tyrosine-type recombinase/integrase [Bifidobacteriaceae bacterium]|nr:tyrosine-type recombinase/integrase [Bifidobacteriaceae bacterium]
MTLQRLPIPADWQLALDRWTLALRAAGRTQQTIHSRTDQLRRLARFLAPGGPYAVTTVDLISWMGAQTWALETRRSARAAVRAFYAWAAAAGYVNVSPAAGLPAVKAAAPCPRPASEDAIAAALAAAGSRETLVLRLAAEIGLRRAEIAQVHLKDLSRDLLGWSLLVHGKGGKDRLVPLTDGLADAIRLAAGRERGWAFHGDDGGHLSPRWVGKLAARLLPDGVTLHMLRHRFASRAWDGSRDLLTIQRILGHASPATTQRYIAASDQAARALAGLPGLRSAA